jgi:hypothetical protein
MMTNNVLSLDHDAWNSGTHILDDHEETLIFSL